MHINVYFLSILSCIGKGDKNSVIFRKNFKNKWLPKSALSTKDICTFSTH